MNSNTLNCLWILVFPIGIIEISTSRKYCFWHHFSSLHVYCLPSISNWRNSSFDSTKMKFLVYFSFFHDYWPPTTLISLLHTSWTKWNDVKTCFSAPQNTKKKNHLKHKNQVRNRLFIDRSSSMKDYTCYYVVIT
jgi:hypothetical protein